MEGHQGEVLRVAFSLDGRHALSGSENGDIYIWDLQTGEEPRRILAQMEVTAVEFSPDRRHALVNDLYLRWVDLDSGRTLARIDDVGWTRAVAFLPDGRSAAFGHGDTSVRVVDLESGREVRRFEGHARQADAVACSPDGRQLVSARVEFQEADDCVLHWDLSAGGPPRRPERSMMLVDALAFSPDGRRVAAAALDGRVYVWEAQTGRELRRLDAHPANARTVAFWPDGRFLVSGGGSDRANEPKEADHSVRIWDVARARELVRFEGHSGDVNSVAVSPDGRHLLSGGADNTVRLWAVP